ncbi:carboxypeptidase regulatory-like domain-containing protein [Bremerella cremea]|uniref:Carboxypeptidase regulatory-like domain-containing protein n=1 Tax=Bremerella cremea TaxID=1031537 RepID=A0A368KTN1_9BACT|nr:carboxypeptidase-like regulatory domain-containing protein [Bremerella cremea]RCS47762.1 carboxypeptidase regulatory-like domain-containing protein [Bremerella cremea]
MTLGKLTRCLQGTAMTAVLLLAVAGCSQEDPMGKVKGKVTFNDKPFTDEASVIFFNSQTGQATSANVDSAGAFQLEPIPLGSYKVFLAPVIEEGYVDPKPMKRNNSIPQKYWSEGTTDITYEVVDGEQDMTVELKK